MRRFVPIALLLALLVVAWRLFQPLTPRSPPVLPTPTAATPRQPHPTPEALAEFESIEQRVAQLDSSLWAPELRAQRCEDVVIDFWDALRRAEDPWTVALAAPPLEIQLQALSPPESLPDGIRRVTGTGPGRRYSPAEWHQTLTAWQTSGLVLEQTEWRMPGYAELPNHHASSRFDVTLHVRTADNTRRWIVRSEVELRWRLPVEGADPPQPTEAIIHRIEILDRAGVPWFREMVRVPIDPQPGNSFIDPLIVQDINGDQLPEVLLPAANTYLRNDAAGTLAFGPILRDPGPLIHAAVLVDLTGDRTPDLVLADGAGLRLHPGARDGTFPGPSRRIFEPPQPLLNPFVLTTGDIDGDGDLDLWLGQYKLPYREGQMPTPYYDARDGFPSFLLRNEGNLRFVDVTEQAGLGPKRSRRFYSGSFVDIDQDGDLDLVQVSDFAGVDLHRNEGSGRFTDITESLAGDPKGFGMGHTFGDLDGDGRMDLYVVGMNSPVADRLDGLGLGHPESPTQRAMRGRMAFGSRLFLGRPTGFEQPPWAGQLARTGWAWGASTGDFDNDGRSELVVVNGHSSRESARDYERQFWRHDVHSASSAHSPAWDLWFNANARRLYGAGYSYGGYEKNRFFLNLGPARFAEVAYLLGVSSELDCRNLVATDLDKDGRLDLVTTSFQTWPKPRQSLILYRNTRPHSGHWIGIDLGIPHPELHGGRVRVRTASGTLHRWLVTGDSHRSQHPMSVHFGLGDRIEVQALEVLGRSGAILHSVPNPGVDRYHRWLGPTGP